MRPTLVVLSICVLLLLSVVAIYKACEPKPSIDDEDDAVTAKLMNQSEAASKENRAESVVAEQSTPGPIRVSPAATNPTVEATPTSNGNRREGAETQANSNENSSGKGGRILILGYPPVPYSRLVDAVNRSELAIGVRVAKDLLVNGRAVRRGDYILMVKNVEGDWKLLFQNDSATHVTIPLRLEGADYPTDKLMVDIDEYMNRATVTIRLGREQLSGSFEIR